MASCAVEEIFKSSSDLIDFYSWMLSDMMLFRGQERQTFFIERRLGERYKMRVQIEKGLGKMVFDYLKISSKFRKIAASTEHHPNWMIPTMASALRQIEKYGYTLRKKRPGSFSETMTTTDVVTKTIWLRVGWDTRPADRNVATLFHELVHVDQADDWGPMLFGIRYGSPRWRWAIEMQAYAVSIEVARSLGANISQIPSEVAETMVKKYKPWFPVSEEEIRSETIACLRKV